jgi:hypothetical protein
MATKNLVDFILVGTVFKSGKFAIHGAHFLCYS